MLGEKPSLYWRICWRYISPTFLLVILCFSVWNHADMLGEEYYYPPWGVQLGWVLTGSSVICIPLYMVYKFSKTRGGCKRVSIWFLNEFFPYFITFLFANNFSKIENPNNVQTRATCYNSSARQKELWWRCYISLTKLFH